MKCTCKYCNKDFTISEEEFNLVDRDEGEQFYEYRRLNPKANSLYNCFPYPDAPNEEEKKIIPFLTKVFEFFKKERSRNPLGL